MTFMYNITKMPKGQSVQLTDNHLIYIWECLKNIKEKTSLYQSYTNRIAAHMVQYKWTKWTVPLYRCAKHMESLEYFSKYDKV